MSFQKAVSFGLACFASIAWCQQIFQVGSRSRRRHATYRKRRSAEVWWPEAPWTRRQQSCLPMSRLRN